MRLRSQSADGTFAASIAHLLKCLGVMLGFDLLAWWALARSAGLPGFGPGIVAVILWSAGVCFTLALLFTRRQSNPIPVLLSLAMAVLGFMFLGDMPAAAKNALKPVHIGTQTGAADAVVTCVRKNVAWVDYSELEGWQVFYTYAADGALHRQYDFVLDTKLHVGEHVRVLYKLGDPALARMLKADERAPVDADARGSAAPLPPLPTPDPTRIAC